MEFPSRWSLCCCYSEHTALRALDFGLHVYSIVWQDSGFTDYGWEEFYLEYEGVEFASQRKRIS